jgi:hypothetical protein
VSYELQLFRMLEGETTQDAVARWVATNSSDDPNPGPVTPEIEDAKRRQADALARRMPSLEPFVFDYQQIAALNKLDEAEARRRWRHIELNEDAFGLQILLYGQTASVASLLA